jgi:hypothetical protein
MAQKLSLGLAVLLVVGYALGLLFSLKTHREIFAGADQAEASEPAWPIGLALGTLAVVTLLVALVSEIFVESVQEAAKVFGMSPAFVGFVVVALVGGAAEMTVAFSAARKDRLDLSVGIALGSASQIALFVGPVLVLLSYVIGPAPMDLQFWPGAVVMVFVATLVAAFVTSGGPFGLVHRRAADPRLCRLCHDALRVAASSAVNPCVMAERANRRPSLAMGDLRDVLRRGRHFRLWPVTTETAGSRSGSAVWGTPAATCSTCRPLTHKRHRPS